MPKSVHMDKPELRKLAKSLGRYGDTLKEANTALKGAMRILELVGWTTIIGGLFNDTYLEQIQPNVDKLMNKMYELQGDVILAIGDIEKGDRYRKPRA